MPVNQSILTHKVDCAFQSITAKLLLKQTVESFSQFMSQLYDKTKYKQSASHDIFYNTIIYDTNPNCILVHTHNICTYTITNTSITAQRERERER